MELSATETLGAIATSCNCAPIMAANFCLALAISPIQISYQACAPHSFHVSMNCARPCIDRFERAHNELLFRYVFRCKIGNSERYDSNSACSMKTGAGYCNLDSLMVIAYLLLQGNIDRLFALYRCSPIIETLFFILPLILQSCYSSY